MSIESIILTIGLFMGASLILTPFVMLTFDMKGWTKAIISFLIAAGILAIMFRIFFAWIYFRYN